MSCSGPSSVMRIGELGRSRVGRRSSCKRLLGSWSPRRRAARSTSRSTSVAGGVEPAVEVHGADHRLHGVGQDRRALAAAGAVLALAQQQDRADVEVGGHLGQRRRPARRPPADRDSSPSSASGNRWKTSSVTTRPSTESPRNSSRSFEAKPECSAHQLRWVRARVSRAGSVKVYPSRSRELVEGRIRRSALSQTAVDVVHGVAHGLQVLEILVVEVEPDRALAQLLLERLDQLDQGERVGLEVVGEGIALVDVPTDRSPGCRRDGRGRARTSPGGSWGPAQHGSQRARRTPREAWKRRESTRLPLARL